MTALKSSALAVAGGAFLALCWTVVPPTGAGPLRSLLALMLALFGLGLTFYALSGVQRDRWRLRQFGIGTLAMLGQFASTLAWTGQFSLGGRIALTLGQAGLAALPWLVVRLHRCPWGALWFASAMTAGQFLRSRTPLSGFPMGSFEPTLAGTPLALIAPLLGPLALTFAASAIAAMLVVGFAALRHGDRDERRAVTKHLAAPLAVLGLLCTLGAFVNTAPTGKTMNVLVVQGGGKQGVLREDQRPRDTFEKHLALAVADTAQRDLIVFPENTAISSQGIENADSAKALTSLARGKQAWIVAGFVQLNNDDTFDNMAVLWDPQGKVADTYTKQHRVPFGEYVPGRSFIERIADLSQVPYDATQSNNAPILRGDPDTVFGVAISYEAMFGDEVRDSTGLGAGLLTIPTNASSYFSIQVSKEQVQHGRLRALENRRWALLAAPTGVSAIIEPTGNVKKASQRGQATTLDQTITVREGKTPYSVLGDVPIIILCVLIALGKRDETCNLLPTCRTQSLPS